MAVLLSLQASILSLIVGVQGRGFLGSLYSSHTISTTSRVDMSYVKYEVFSSPKPQAGTFLGMPPPVDSPYMGSTYPPVIVPREVSSSLPVRGEPGTAPPSRTEARPGPTRRFEPAWRDEDDLRTSTEKGFGTRGSKEEQVEGWSSFSLFGKGSEGKTKSAEKWCSRFKTKCKSAKSDSNGIIIRITGGVPAKPKQHPHMVMIGYGQGGNKQWLCGGSLVSSRFVLSAAHCVNTAKIGPASWVRLGELDIASTSDDARPQEREIAERFVHPDYREPAVYHDIALFKMDRDVVFNAWISPVCLHGDSSSPSQRATITGWGRTNFVSDTSAVLMEAAVTVFNSTYCKETVDKIAGTKMPRGYDPESMICAGEERGGKDACQGDSGGPLVTDSGGCSKLQIGITSVGRECGLPNSPGVYTRVSYYITWLEGVIWG